MKIAIEQLFYRVITNATFRYAIQISTAFDIRDQVAEGMKSVSQGRALNNLLEVAFLHIARILADLFIACIVFYLNINDYGFRRLSSLSPMF